MSASAFQFTAANPLTTQPNSAGEKLIARSDNAADTGNLSTVGLVSAVSTSDTTALLGKREIQTADTYTTLSIALLSAAQTGSVTLYGQGTKAQGDLRVDSLPANNDTLLIGLTGFTQTYTFKTTLTGAANEIKIAASVAAQATNIYEAINAGANAGTDYGTGTAANAFLTASAPVGAVVTLTDKLAVSRQLTWALSQGVGATISIRTMVGGATGTLLATLTAGVTSVYNSFSLASEDLSAYTIPALFTGTSAAIQVGGRPFTLRFKGAGISSGIAMNYQTSTDGTNWADHVTAISNVTNSHTVAAPQMIAPAELNAEYVRLNITTNANTADAKVDGRVTYG